MNLEDLGAFDEGRYFDVIVEYAKRSPSDILMAITVENRGPDPAPLHVLPHLWFRNTWSWSDPIGPMPEIRAMDSEPGCAMVRASHPSEFGAFHLYIQSIQREPELLFTNNETNSERLFGTPSRTPYVKDAFHERVIGGDPRRVSPERRGTKAASWHRLLVPAGGRERILLRLSPEPLDVPAYRERNRIERLFAKAKEFRRIATRYDKRKRMYLGWLHLVFGFIRLRAKTNVHRA